jgi:alkanesulfonate monooxygenase SsuD/methylene tetrahydromethanopterin reductase-like flavin-dependent oxidoreductase (luciferase family)
MDRLGRLEPPPRGRLPIMIGGSGEKVTLRLVAEHADAWNSFGPADRYAQKNAVLNEWCQRLGRAPHQIERTVALNTSEVDDWKAFVDAGADHLIVMTGPPFDLEPTERLLRTVRT